MDRMRLVSTAILLKRENKHRMKRLSANTAQMEDALTVLYLKKNLLIFRLMNIFKPRKQNVPILLRSSASTVFLRST